MKLTILIISLALLTSCSTYHYTGAATPIYTCRCSGYVALEGKNQEFYQYMDAESILEIRKNCKAYHKNAVSLKLQQCTIK